MVESGESMLPSLRVRPTRVICGGTHQRDVKARSRKETTARLVNHICIFTYPEIKNNEALVSFFILTEVF